MIDISIYFNEFQGILKDLEFCLYFIYNNNYESENKKYDISPNKNVEQSLVRLSKKVHLSSFKKYIDLFLNEKVTEDKLAIGIPVEEHTFWSFSNIDEFILYLKNMNNETFISAVMKCIDNVSRDMEEVEKILKDKEYMIDLLQKLPLSDEFKWELMELICNVDIYKENYINFLTYFYPLYIDEVRRNKKYIDKFKIHVIEKIKNEGEKYIKDLLSCQSDDLYISIAFYGNFAIQKGEYEETTYLLLGIDAEQIYSSRNNKKDKKNIIDIYKNLGDITRFNVLKIISENNSITMQELSNKLNVSVPTIKYHIDSLIFYNLMRIKKKGNKSIYEINKEILKDSINYIVKEFNL